MFLRQSTSQVIRFGPFLDSTDGVTPETALTIAQADMQLSKDGAAFAQKNAAGNATHDTDGWYSTTLNTTDTNTVGEIYMQVNVTGALPVWIRYWVLEEAIYDDLYGASAVGYLKPTVASRTLDVSAGGAIEDVILVATTTTNTDMVGTDGANTVAPDNAGITANGVAIAALNDFNPATDTVANVTTVATTTTNTDMRGTDSAFLAASAPTNFSALVISGAGAVDSLLQGFINTAITETSVGRISNNFDFFYDNADAQTTQVVDDVGGGGGGGTDWTASERNEIRGRLGVTGTTAAGGNTPTLSTQTSVDDVPTNAEFNARTLVAASYFDPAADTVANVTLCATTTTNTDMVGTDGANTVAPDNAGITANGVAIAALNDFNPATEAVANVTLVATTTTNTDMVGTDGANTIAPDNAGISSNGAAIAALNDITVSDILTTQMTQSFAADGVAPTLAQALFIIQQNLGDFSITGTTVTVNEIDGATTAATYTLNDGTNPTAKTRTS